MPPAPSSRMSSYWPRRAPTPAGDVMAGGGAPDRGAGVANGLGARGGGSKGEGIGDGRSGASGVGRGGPRTGLRVLPGPEATGLGVTGAAAGPPPASTRVAAPLGGRGSIRPDTSLPFSGRISVRAGGRDGSGEAAA